MYSILAHVTIQPQHVDEYLSLIREHARDSLRDEAGTLGFEVIQDEKDPTHFYVHETYADEAAFHTICTGKSPCATSQRWPPWPPGSSMIPSSSGRGLISSLPRPN